MKKVLALAVSLLMPAVPVLAQTPPDSTQQTVDARMNASAQEIPKAFPSGASSDATAVTATPVNTGAQTPVKTAEAQPEAGAQARKNLTSDVSKLPKQKPGKPSFFSKMKATLMTFVMKHPVITGAIVGAIMGAFGGPAGMVIGASLGAVAADAAHYYMKK